LEFGSGVGKIDVEMSTNEMIYRSKTKKQLVVGDVKTRNEHLNHQT
jgi:hypothetical protein